jgi:hypothetical protein
VATYFLRGATAISCEETADPTQFMAATCSCHTDSGTPTPLCFCQRVRNRLKRNGLSFVWVQKSAKECARVSKEKRYMKNAERMRVPKVERLRGSPYPPHQNKELTKFVIHKQLIPKGLALRAQKWWKRCLERKAAARCRTPQDFAVLPDINYTIQVRPVKGNIACNLARGAISFRSRPGALGW